MIRLHPIPDAAHKCPTCNKLLEVQGWYMPGMRCLAELHCAACGKSFYGDLASGHALHQQEILDVATGVVCAEKANWYGKLLQESFGSRSVKVVGFAEEVLRTIRRPLVLNCLDCYYGHSLLKLLNAQQHLDHDPDYDLIVIVPKWLRWMVPDGCAAVWTIDMPLREGDQWNDWLATQFKQRLQGYAEAWLSPAYSHPHPAAFDIERFTRVKPFQVESWEASVNNPVITFIWRSDRFWCHKRRVSLPWFLEKMHRRILKRTLKERIGVQNDNILLLAERLRMDFPNVSFSVVGIGLKGGFPDWIKDLRTEVLVVGQERAWCRQYARSHCVVGVHGSNMLLPSGHARLTVDLMPVDRWGNMLQDILVQESEIRAGLLRYHCVPISVSPGELHHVIMLLLRSHAWGMIHMARNAEDVFFGRM